MTPEQWTALLIAVTPLVGAVCALGVVMLRVLTRRVDNLHDQFNSRFDELSKANVAVGRAEGLEEGRADLEQMRQMIRDEVRSFLSTPQGGPD